MMTDILDDAKRVKWLEKFLFVLSNNKMILKDLENPDEHVTMLFTDKGIIDVHTTKEGTEKQYESLGQFDLTKAIKEISSDPKYEEKFVEQLLKGIKKVTFDESEYSHLGIANLQIKDKLLSYAQKTKRNVTIPSDALEGLTKDDVIIPWNKAKGKINEYGIVLDNGDLAGWVFEEKEGYLYLPISALGETAFAQLIKSVYEMRDQNDSKGKK